MILTETARKMILRGAQEMAWKMMLRGQQFSQSHYQQLACQSGKPSNLSYCETKGNRKSSRSE
eukprot:1961515-Amphidinium_carterae.1